MIIQTHRLIVLAILPVLAAGCGSAAAQPVTDGIYTDPTGTVELSLANGNWFVNHDVHKHVEEGTYKFSGNQIQFTLLKQDSGDLCDSGEKTFAYQWTLAGKSITLTHIDDQCNIRSADLTWSPLSLKGTAQ